MRNIAARLTGAGLMLWAALGAAFATEPPAGEGPWSAARANACSQANMLVEPAEIERRRQALEAAGGYPYPKSQAPWQEMQRATVGELATGAVLEPSVKFQRLAQTAGIPRHSP